MDIPGVRDAKSGDIHIAYQVVGDGPIDLVLLPGLFSQVEHHWEEPSFARFMRRLAIHPIKVLLTKATHVTPITPALTDTNPETLKSYPLHKVVIVIRARIGVADASCC